jgi:hypothetical protein
MDIPGLGRVTQDSRLKWYRSSPIAVPMFGGKMCSIIVDGYEQDPNKEDFHIAIANFLKGSSTVLREVDQHLFKYYKAFEEWYLEDGSAPIQSADELWQHVQLGSEPMVTRRYYGDKKIYVSVECECDWEPEHGLQLVLKNGLRVTKLGGYDGHLTNSDAFDDESLEDVVYRSFAE